MLVRIEESTDTGDFNVRCELMGGIIRALVLAISFVECFAGLLTETPSDLAMSLDVVQVDIRRG
jgi:hypothetical protein